MFVYLYIMAKKKGKNTEKKAKNPKITHSFNGAPSWFTDKKIHLILIGVFSLLLYFNTINHDFALDDAIVITENEYTTKGFAGIPNILSKDTFRGFFKVDGKEKLVSGGRYRPLTLVQFAIGYSIFGENATIGHIMNIFWYALTGMVLYLLLMRLFKNRISDGFAVFIALATSLLFIAHPVHTECVANIKGRDEIMALLGSLATAYLILKSWQEKNDKLVLFAALVFFVTLFSKENAITFLGVIPLMLFAFTKASISDINKKMMPLIGAAIAFIIVRTAVIGFDIGANPPLELMNNPFVKVVGNQNVYFSFSEKFATIMFTLLKYIELLFAPLTLTHDYYPRHIEMMSMSDPKVIISIVLHIALLVFGIMQALKKKLVGFGILYYLGTLFIVSNFLFPVGTNMAERFLFMPSVGWCLIIAYLLYQLGLKISKTDKISNFKQLNVSFGLLGLICIGFSVLTIMRNPVWKNNLSLFTIDAKTSIKSAKLQNAAGGVLLDTYNKEKNEQIRNQKFNEAVVHLKQAVAIHPTYKNAYLLLGNAHNYLKQFEPSIKYYEQALALDPNYKEAKNNIAITYRDAGRYYGEQKNDLQKSLQYLQKSEQANPEDFETLRLLGVAFGIAGQGEKAISYFLKCTKIQPNNAGVWLNLGNAYGQLGDIQKAETYRSKAKSIDPNIF